MNPEDVTSGQIGQRMAEDVAYGAATEGVVRAGGALLRKLTPYEQLAARVRAERVPVARKMKSGEVSVGETVSAQQEAVKSWKAAKGVGQAGVGLTAGQASRSKELLGAEGFLSRFAETIPMVGERITRQLEEFHNLAVREAKKISAPNIGADEAANRFALAVRAGIETMVEARRIQGAREFAEAQKLGGSIQNIPLRNLTRVAKKISAEGEQAFASPQAAALADWAKREIDKLKLMSESGRRPTRYSSISGIQNLLHTFGKQSASLGELIPGLGRTETQKIGRQLFAAVMKDLDAMVADEARSPLRAEAVRALRKARDNWRVASEEIEKETTRLAQRAIGLQETGNAEDIVSELISGKKGVNDIRKAFAIVERSQPAVADQMRRAAFEALVEGKVTRGEIVGDVGVDLPSPQKHVTAYMANKKKIDAAMSGNPKAMEALQRYMRVAKRIGMPTGAAGSPTQPLAWQAAFWNKALSILPGAGKLAPGVLEKVKAGAPLFMTKTRLADILFDPEKAKVLLGVMEAPKNFGGSKAARLLGRVAAMFASEESKYTPTDEELAEMSSSITRTEGLPRMGEPIEPGMSKEDWIREFEREIPQENP